MSKKKTYYTEELKQLKEYIKSDNNEDAKRPLLYPLFKKLFKDKFKIESDANNADIYIEGTLIVESKTSYSDWLAGFYQALHYQKKYGLAYSTLFVIAHKFVGIWKVNKIPEFAVIQSYSSDANIAPNKIGKLNARKTTNKSKKEIQNSAIYWLEPKNLDLNFFKDRDKGAKSILHEVHEILNILTNIDSDRIQINTHNFIQSIDYFKKFFDNPINAVHCFYSIVAYWDITSTIATNEYLDTFQLVGFKGQRISEQVIINPNHFEKLKKYIETHYIFTNEGSGLTVDYYFGRFDEALASIDPEYVKQHGIFFTDSNLGKFALWFASKNILDKIGEDYIVFDPAAGSGNLISNWRMKLRHKIVSELQPDLLRTIERRMRIDPFHIETGFTIIPRTSENIGLNFLDKNAKDYLSIIQKELSEKNQKIERPIAFLLNPPFKNTREKKKKRTKKEADYKIDKNILELAGGDAVKEKYLSFIAQIINICKEQNKNFPDQKHLLLIFTPTSWLIPRIAFKQFKKTFDNYFNYINGFIVKSNEFFKISGNWPVAFTVWEYSPNEKRENKINIYDLTNSIRDDFSINWNSKIKDIDTTLNEILVNTKRIKLFDYRTIIKASLPKIEYSKNKFVTQKMQNFYRNKRKDEIDKKIISGFALKDDRHQRIKAPHGFTDGTHIGFMDNVTPVRIRPKKDIRYKDKTAKDSVWFRLDSVFINVNQTKCFNGPSDNRSYCAYDLESAKATFSWFALTKAVNGKYPLWANQFDIWQPKIKKELENYYYALCYAFALAENRCVITKFEAGNPVDEALEIFVDNPLCPTNKEAFWATILDNEVTKEHDIAFELVSKIKELYKTWNFEYCKGQFLFNVRLKNEPYFKYFDYQDFLTPYSGLIQIRKHAEIENLVGILDLFDNVRELTKKVKTEIYNLLVNKFKYFE